MSTKLPDDCRKVRSATSASPRMSWCCCHVPSKSVKCLKSWNVEYTNSHPGSIWLPNYFSFWKVKSKLQGSPRRVRVWLKFKFYTSGPNFMKHLIFICPCIVIIIPNYSQQDATFLDLFISTDALLVSGGSSAHHQEHINVHTVSGILNQYRCLLL